jgi:hypothetical protein
MWYLTGAVVATKRLLSKAHDVEREQVRRLNEAYTRWAGNRRDA